MEPFTRRGVHATIVHHTNKGDYDAMNRISGTQAMKAAPETIHVVSKLKFSGNFTGILEVATEMRYHNIVATRYLKRGLNGHFFITDKEEAMKPMEEELRITLHYLKLAGHPQPLQYIISGAQLDKGRAPAILKELEERGEVENYGGKFGVAGMGFPTMGSGPGGSGRPNEKIGPLKEIIFGYLTGKPNGVRKSELSNIINEGMDISQPSIDRYLSQFLKEGILVAPKMGVYALPTPALPDWL